MRYIKTFEKKYVEPFRRNRKKNGPKPKFNVGDEVIVMYDLTQFGYPYGIVKGDIVTIVDYWINANDDISYKIDSPKLREIKKGRDIEYDMFDEFHFAYEYEEDANKYNL